VQATQWAPLAPPTVDVRTNMVATAIIDKAPTNRDNSPAIIESVSAPSGIYPTAKYAAERLLAVLLIVVLAPVMVAAAIAVRVSMGRGIVYRQERVGRNGSVFLIYKLRTMCHDRRGESVAVAAERRCTHKSSEDPRHTSIGKILRKTSLDELPQLLNVIRGEMALIGPRPELATIVSERDLWHHPRHLVRPGITGLWQVSEYRHLHLYEHMELDVEYVKRVSVVTDLEILAKTIRTLCSANGE
jgi:lipopolysaccharide/colanic/teichoic acid biosynthesis glycosyltransferase